MRLLFIILTLLFSTSCVTQKKCYDKFPSKLLEVQSDTIYKDSLIYVIDTVIVPKTSLNTDYFTVRDTIIQNDTIIVKIKEKGGQIKLDVQTKEYYLIDSFKIVVQNQLIKIKEIEQLYFDQKTENKRLKIERKPLVQEAKTKKWTAIGEVLNKGILALLILIAISILLYNFTKRR